MLTFSHRDQRRTLRLARLHRKWYCKLGCSHPNQPKEIKHWNKPNFYWLFSTSLWNWFGGVSIY